LSVLRFFFTACSLTLSFGVAALCAAVSVVPFLDVSFLAREVSEESDVFFVFFLGACSAGLSASSRERLVVEFAAGALGCAGAMGLVGGTFACCFVVAALSRVALQLLALWLLALRLPFGLDAV
jgi:hypothetical protein